MPKVCVLRRLVAVFALLCVGLVSIEAAAQSEPRPKRKGRRYKVRVDSSPQRAAVYLDDEKYGIVGYTPWEGRIQKGDWKVIVKLEGYETATRVVRVKRSRRVQEFFLPMTKKDVPGTLDVVAAADKNAFGADVWVDGQLQGKIPVVLEVPDGRHLVEIKKDEFSNYEQWVDVKEGDRITIAPTLKPKKKAAKKGSILVDADVQDAEVYIDGTKWKDKTPTLIPDVTVGPHVIEVRKAPSMPWKQTVTVQAGATAKVSAQLQASAGGPGGAVRVLASAPDAVVYVDGTKMGVAPIDIKDLKPGEHVIEVRAPGHMPKKKRVKVSAGSAAVIEFELQPEAAGGGGTIKIVSPVPDAAVSIDGERIGKVPQSKEVTAGEHFVRVEKKGYRTFEEKVRVEPGQAITVTAELKAAGSVRVLSTPAGSTVSIDGEAVGKTPYTIESVSVGVHVLTVTRDDYYNFEKEITVSGGKREVVNATLKKIDLGPTAEEIAREQRSRSSFSARTLTREKPTADLSIGYPHFFEVRFTIGVGKLKGFGLDAGISVKSFLQRTDLALTNRLQLLDKSPVALGVFSVLGYGTRFDRSQRDSYFFDAGGMVSLTAVGRLTITGRAYLSMWTDRFCPPVENSQFEARSDPSEMCRRYLEAIDGNFDDPEHGPLEQERIDRIEELLEDDNPTSTTAKLFDRNSGIRPMFSLIVEYAYNKKINIWGILEGTPSQDERPAFTHALNTFLMTDDNGVYFRGGFTYKF